MRPDPMHPALVVVVVICVAVACADCVARQADVIDLGEGRWVRRWQYGG